MTVREHKEALARAERARAMAVVTRAETLEVGPADRSNVLDVREVCNMLRIAWLELDEAHAREAFLDDLLSSVLKEHAELAAGLQQTSV